MSAHFCEKKKLTLFYFSSNIGWLVFARSGVIPTVPNLQVGDDDLIRFPVESVKIELAVADSVAGRIRTAKN